MIDFTTLVPVVVGGLIGLAGGLLGPLVLEGRKQAAEKKKKRAEKFEELVEELYAFDHWLDNERTRALGGDIGPPEVSPFARIQAISTVYFPNFDQLIRQLDEGTATYRVWIETSNYKRVSGKMDAFPAGYAEALKCFTDPRDKLLDALKEFARREFQ
jgi:hypothetical protein